VRVFPAFLAALSLGGLTESLPASFTLDRALPVFNRQLWAPPLPVAAPVHRGGRSHARSSGTSAKRAWKRTVRGGHRPNRPRSR
jgi:hypothetical protein